ncbi:extracellular matrix-binding protein ebh-like [Branchiostoma lanceolatum]|uniref:extracellular matrix-binding protein ebh-like n=1 Tax=Branchiostoma lanceolatum TaxID=7740 RepID=UPI003455D190
MRKREKTIGGPGAVSTSKIDEDKVLDSVKMILGEKNIEEAPDEDPSGSQSDMDRLLEEFAFLEVVRSRLSGDGNNAQEKKNIISSRGDVDLMTATRLVMQAMLQDCTRSTQNAIYDSGMYTAPNEQSILYNDILQELSSVYASLQTAGRQTDQSGLLSAVDSLERALGAEALTVIVIPKMGRQGISRQSAVQKYLSTVLSQYVRPQPSVLDIVSAIGGLQPDLTPSVQQIMAASSMSPTREDISNAFLLNIFKALHTIYGQQGIGQTMLPPIGSYRPQSMDNIGSLSMVSTYSMSPEDAVAIVKAMQKSPLEALQVVLNIIQANGVLLETNTVSERLQNIQTSLTKDDVERVVEALEESPQAGLRIILQIIQRSPGTYFTGSTQDGFQNPLLPQQDDQQAIVEEEVQKVQNAQLQGVLTKPESQVIQTAVQESPSAALTKVVQTVGDKAGQSLIDQLKTIKTIQKIQGDLTQSQVSKVLTGLQESPQEAMQVLQTVVQETTQKKTQATQQSKTVIQTLTSLGRLTTDDSDKITDAFKTSPADAIQTIIGVVGEKVDLSDTDRQRLVTVVQNNKDKLGSQDVASVVQAWQTSPQQAMSVITQTVGRKTGQTVSVHFTGSTQLVFQQPQQATFQQTAQQVQSVVQQAQLQGVLTQPESQAIQTAVQESPSAALTKVVQTTLTSLGRLTTDDSDKITDAFKTSPADAIQTIIGVVGEKVDLSDTDRQRLVTVVQNNKDKLGSQDVASVVQAWQTSPQQAMSVITQTVGRKTGQTVSVHFTGSTQQVFQQPQQATFQQTAQQVQSVVQQAQLQGVLTQPESQAIQTAVQESPSAALTKVVQTTLTSLGRLTTDDSDKITDAFKTSPADAIQTIIGVVGEKVDLSDTDRQRLVTVVQNNKDKLGSQDVASVVQAWQTSPQQAMSVITQTVGRKTGQTVSVHFTGSTQQVFQQPQQATFQQTAQQVQSVVQQAQLQGVLTQPESQAIQTAVQESPSAALTKVVQTTLTSLGRLTTDDSDKITDAFKTSPADAIQTIIGVVGEKVDLSDTDRQRLVTVVQNNKDKLGSQDVASVVQAWQTSPQQAMSVITQTVGRKTGQTVSVHFTGSTQQVFQQPQQATFQQTAQQVQSVVQQAQLQGVLTQPESQAIQTAVQESPSAALTKVVQTVGDKAGKTPLDQLQTIQTIQKIQGDLTQSQVSKVLTGLQESPQKAMQVLQTVVQETTQKKTQATQQSKTVIQTLTSLGRLTTDDSDKITDAFKTSPADAIQTIIGVVGEKVDLSDTDRQRLVTVVQNNKDKLGSQDVASVVQAWQTSPQQAMSLITQTVGRKTGQTISVHFTGSTQHVFQQPQQATFQQTAQQVQSVVQQAQLQGVLTQPESQAIQTAVQESPSAALTKVVQTTLTSLGRLTTDDSDKITDAFKTSPADAIQTIIGVVGEKVDLSDTDRQRLVTVVQNNKDKLGSQDVASVVQAWQTSPQQAISVITQTVGRKTGQTVSVHFTGSTQQVFQQPQQATFQETAQQVQSVVQQAQLQGVLTQPESQAIQTAVQESPSAALTKVVQTVGDKAGKTPLDQLQTIQTIQKIQGDLTQSQVSKVLTGLQESPQKAMQVLQTLVQETTQKKTQATQQSKTVIQTLTSLGRLTTDDSDKITDAFKTSPADAIQTIIGVVGEKVDLSDTDRQRLVTVVQNNKDKLGSQDVASVVQAWQTSPQQAMSVITQTVGRKTGQTVSVHFTGSTQQVFQQPQQATFQQTAQQVQSVVQQAQLQGVLTQPESQAIQTAVQESPSAALTKVVQTTLTSLGRLTTDDSDKITDAFKTSPADAIQTIIGVVGEKVDLSDTDRQRLVTVVQNNKDKLGSQDVASVVQAWQTSPQQAMSLITQTVGRKTGQTVSVHFTGSTQQVFQQPQQATFQQTAQQVQSVVQQAQLQGVLTQPESQAIQTAVQESPSAALTKVVQTTLTSLGRLTTDDSDKITDAFKTSPADAIQTIIGVVGEKVDLSDTDRQRLVTVVQNNKDKLGSQDVASVVQAWQTSPQQAMSLITQTVGRKTGQTVSVHFTGSTQQVFQQPQQATFQQTAQQVQSVVQQAQLQGVLTQPESQAIQTAAQESPSAALTKVVQTTLTSLGRLTTDDSDKITDAFKTSPADAIQTIIGVVGEKVDLSDTDRQRLVTVVQNNKDKLGSQDVASVVQAWQTSPQQAMSLITQTVGRKTGQTVSVHFTGSTQQVFQQPQQATFQETAQQVQSVVQQAQLQGVLTQPESQAIQTAVQESPSAALTKVVQTTLTSLGRLTTDDSDKITDAFKTSPADAIQTIIGVVGEKVDLSDTDRQRLVTVVQNNKDKLGSQDVASVVQAWQTSPQQAMSLITQTVGRKTGQTVSVHFTGSTQQVFQQPQQATFQQTAQQVQSVVQQAQLQGVLTQPESQAIQTAVQESPSAALTKVVQTVGDKAGKTPLDQLQTIQTIQKIQGDLTQSQVSKVLTGLQESPQKAMQVLQTLVQETTQKKTQATQQSKTVIQTLTSLGRLTTDDSDKITDAFKTSPADAIQTIIGVVGEKVDLSDTDRQRLVTVVQNNKDKLGSQDVASVVQAWQTSPQQAMSLITQTVGRKTGQTVSVHFTGSTQQVFQQPQQATFQETAQQVQSVVQQAQLQGVLTQPESQAIQTAVQESPSAALTKVVQTTLTSLGRLTTDDSDKITDAFKTSPADAIQTIIGVVGEKVDLSDTDRQRLVTVVQNNKDKLGSQDVASVVQAWQTSPQQAMSLITQTVGRKTGQTVSVHFTGSTQQVFQQPQQATFQQTAQQVQSVVQQAQLQGVLTQPESQAIQTAVQESPSAALTKVVQTTLTSLGRLTTDDSDKITDAFKTSPADAIQTIIGVVGEKVDLSDTDRQRLVTVVQNNKDKLGSQDVASVVQAWQTSPQQAMSLITQTVGRKTGQTVSVHFTGSTQQVFQQPQQATFQETAQQVQSVVQQAQLQGVLTQPESQAIQTAVQESPSAALTKVVQTTLTSLGRLTTDDSDKITDAFKTSPADAIQTIIGVVGEKVDLSDTDRQRLVTVVQNNKDKLGSQDVASVVQAWQTSPQQAMSLITQTVGRKTGQTVSVHFTGSTQQVFQQPQQATFQQTAQQVQSVVQQAQLQGVLTQPESQAIQTAVQESPSAALTKVVQTTLTSLGRLTTDDSDKITDAFKTSPADAIQTIIGVVGEKVDLSDTDRQRLVTVVQNNKDKLGSQDVASVVQAWQTSPQQAMSLITQTVGRKTGQTVSVHFTGSTQQVFQQPQQATFQETAQQVQSVVQQAQLQGVLTQPESQAIQTAVQESPSAALTKVVQTTLTSLGRLTTDDSDKITDAFKTSPADAIQTIIGVVGEKVDLSDTDRHRLVTVVQNNKDKLGSQDVASVVQAWQTSPQQAMSVITQTVGRKTGQTVSVHFTGSTQQVFQQPQQATFQQTAQQVQSVVQQAQLQGVLTQPESQAIQTAVQESPSAALTKVVQTTLTSLGRLTTDDSDKITDAFKTSPADAIQTIIGVVGEKVDLSDTDRQRLVTVVQNNKDKLGSQDVASVVQAWQTSPQQAMSLITQTVGRKTGQTVSVHFTGSTQQVFQQPQQATFQQTAQQVQSVVQQAQLQGVLTQPESQAIQTAVQESPSAALTKVVQTVGDKAGKTPLDQLQTIQTIQKIQGDITQSQVSKVLTGLQESPQKAMQVLQTVVQETTQKKTQATQQSKTVIQTLTSLGRLTTDDSDKITDAFKTSPADAIQTIIGVVGEKVDLSDTDRQRLVTVVQNNKDKLGSQDVASVVQAWQTSPQQAISVITQTVGRKTGQTVSVHFTGSTQQVFQQPQQATFQETAQQVQSVVQQAQLQGVLTQPESQAIQTAVQESPSAALTKVVQTVGDKAGKTPLDQLQTIQTIQKIQGDLTQSQVSKVLTGLQESPQKAMQVLQTVVQETTQKKTQATQQSKTVIQTLTSLGRLTTDDSDKITDAFKTSPADAIQTIIGVVGEKVDLSDTDRQRLVTVVQNNKDKLGSQDVASVVQAWQTSPQQAMSLITQTVGRKTGQTVSVHFTGSTQQVFQQPQQATFQQTAQQVQSVVQQAQLQGVLTQPESQAIQTAVQESPSAALTKVVQTTLTSLGRLTTDDSDKITDAFKTSPADAIQTIIGVVGEKVDLSDTDRQRLVTVVQNNKDKLGSQDVASVVQAWQTSPQQAMSLITQTVGRKTGQTVSVHFTGSTQQVFQQPQQATFQQTAQQVQSVVQQAQLQGVLTQPESQAIQTAVQESPSAALTKVVQTTLTSLGRLTTDDSDKITDAFKTSPADAIQTIIGVVGEKVDLSDTDRHRLVTVVQNNKDKLGSQDVASVVQAWQTSPQQAMSLITQTVGRKTGQTVSVHFTGSTQQVFQQPQQATFQETAQQVQSVVQQAQLQGVLTQPESQAIQTAVQESPSAALTKVVQTTLTSLGRLTTDDSDKITDAFKTSPADAIQTIIGVVGEKVDLSDTDRQRLVTVVQNNKDKLGSQDVASVVQAWQTSPQQAMSLITQTVGRKTGQTVSVHFTGSTQQVFQQPQQATFQQTAQQVQSVVQQAQLQGVLTQPESQAIQTAVQESPSAALTKVVQTTLTSLGRLTTDDSDKITDAFKTSPADAIQTIIGVVGEKVDISDTDRHRLVTVVQNNKDKLGSQDVASVVQAWQTSPQQAMSVITQTVGRKTGQTVSVHFTGSTQQVFQQPQQATFQQTAQQVQSVVQQAQLQGVLTQPESQAIQTAVQESPSAALTKVVQTTLTSLGRLTTDDSDKITDAFKTSPADAIQTIIGVVGEKVDLSDTDRHRLVTVVQNNKDKLGSQDVASVVQAWQTSPQQAMSLITQTVGRKTGQTVSVHFTGSTQQVFKQPQQATFQETAQQVQSVVQQAQLQGVLTQPESQAIQTAVQESPSAALTKVVQTVGDKAGKTPLDQLQTIQTIQKIQGDLTQSQVSKVLTGLQESPQKAMQVLQTLVQETTQKKTQATQQSKTVIQTLTSLGRLTTDDSDKITDAFKTSPADAIQTIIGVVGEKVDLSDTDRQRLVTVVQNNKDKLGSQDVASVVQAWQTSPQQAMSLITQTVGRKTGQTVSVHFTGSTQQVFQQPQQATFQQTAQQVQSVVQQAQLQGVLTQPESQAIQTAVQESPSAALTKVVQTVGDKAGKTPLDQLQTIQTIQKIQGDLTQSQVSKVLTGLQESPQKAMQVLQTLVQETTQKKTQATQQSKTVIQTLTSLGRLTTDDSDKITDAFKTSPADAIQTIIGVVGEKVDLSDTDRQRLVTVVQNNKDKLGSQDVASVVQAWQTSPQQAMSLITQTVGRKTGQTVSVHFTGSTQQVFQQPQQATFQETAQQVQSVVQQAQLQGVLTQPESQAIQTAVQESPSAALTKVVQTTLTSLGRLTTDDSDKITDAFKTSPADAIQTIIGVVGEKVDLSDTDRHRLVTVVQNNKDKLSSQDVASVVQAWQTSPQQAMSLITQTVGRKTGQTVSVHFTGSTQQVFQQPQQATFQETAQQVQSVVQQAQLQGVLTQPESQAIQTAVQESPSAALTKVVQTRTPSRPS